MQDTYDAAEVRELLAIIADALDPPFAAPGRPGRADLLEHRAAIISGAIRPVADGGAGPRHAMYLRELLAEPLGYEPKPQGGTDAAGSEGK
jgi:hypothetical protein